MNIKILFGWLLLVGLSTNAQIQGGGGLPKSNKVTQHFVMPVEHFSEPDIMALRQEDSLIDAQKAGPWRFGYNNHTNLTLANSGAWITLPNGGKIWRLKLVCENALTVNLTLDNVTIPEGNELYVYNEDKSFILGKFTSQHLCENVLGTELVPGNTAIVEYYVAPNNPNGSFRFDQVTHGYRTANEFAEKAFGSSGSCNNNANCPSGSAWANEKRSVVMLVSGSNGFCSGALVNNTLQDGKPYILTANHCYSTPTNWIFRFNWEAAGCPNPGSSPTFQSINGAVLRARDTPSDFCLVEMTATSGTPFVNGTVPSSFNPYFAGWDATGAFPTSAVGIHHPSGDIKKISFENNPLLSGTWAGTPANSHWRVDYWDSGVTEGGSSGSPLFDQNHRIVGQLHGGASGCGNADLSDEYGKLSLSWTNNPSISAQLKHWLDPNNSGLTILDGYDPNVAVTPDNAGVNAITSPNGLYCSGQFVPVITLKNYGNNALTSVTINYNVDGGTNNIFAWTGNLAPSASTSVTLPSMTVAAGAHVFNCATSMPNGLPDTGTGNDANSSSFTTSTAGQPITISVTTDCWGYETYWELRDVGNNLVANGGNQEFVLPGGTQTATQTDLGAYGDQTTVNTTLCLAVGCYDFTIYDDYGDGMEGTSSGCSSNGSYTITDSAASVLASIQTVNFGDSETNHFCVGMIDPCTNPLVANFTNSSPEINGNDGSISITVSGGLAPYGFAWTGPSGFNSTLEDLTGLSAGTYSVTVTDDCNHSVTISGITIQNVAGIEESSLDLFKVYPNPNKGVFTVQLIDGNSDAVVSVMDLSGRIIQTEKMVGASSIISIENVAQGTYLIKVTTEQYNKTVSLILVK